MRFAHFADCHVGGWREGKLRDLNLRAFGKAIDMCIGRSVDFIVIAGDLFNTSYPDHDSLKVVVTKLKLLRDNKIPVYIVAGSHDFSASGKTMIGILEEAELLKNIGKAAESDGRLHLVLTVDEKTKTVLAGLPGRKGMLDRSYYECLHDVDRLSSYSIFAFHTAITEYKEKDMSDMDSMPLSILPKGFDYYAGGHVHFVFKKSEPGYGTVAFPGPIFPNNMKELEDLGRGGFYLVDQDSAEWLPVQVASVFQLSFDCQGKSPEIVTSELLGKISRNEFNDTIVLMRIIGTLSEGRPSDIDWGKIYDACYARSAVFVMRNSSKLFAKDFEEVKVSHASIEELEDRLMEEHLGRGFLGGEQEKKLLHALFLTLEKERGDGEKVSDFERRIVQETDFVLKTNL